MRSAACRATSSKPANLAGIRGLDVHADRPGVGDGDHDQPLAAAQAHVRSNTPPGAGRTYWPAVAKDAAPVAQRPDPHSGDGYAAVSGDGPAQQRARCSARPSPDTAAYPSPLCGSGRCATGAAATRTAGHTSGPPGVGRSAREPEPLRGACRGRRHRRRTGRRGRRARGCGKVRRLRRRRPACRGAHDAVAGRTRTWVRKESLSRPAVAGSPTTRARCASRPRRPSRAGGVARLVVAGRRRHDLDVRPDAAGGPRRVRGGPRCRPARAPRGSRRRALSLGFARPAVCYGSGGSWRAVSQLSKRGCRGVAENCSASDTNIGVVTEPYVCCSTQSRSSAKNRVVADASGAGRAAAAPRACRPGRRTCRPGRGRRGAGPAAAPPAALQCSRARASAVRPARLLATTATRSSRRSPRAARCRASCVERQAVAEPLVGQLVGDQPLVGPAGVEVVGAEDRQPLRLQRDLEVVRGDHDGVRREGVRPEQLR